jgi:hypothetical protein
MGRNGGGVINMVIKSGRASCMAAHSTNRNEFFAANTPLAPAGSKVRRIRNQQEAFH